MTMAHDLIIDQFSPMGERQTHLTTWYAQGHSDNLGDRLLMFDNTTAPSWEILRFTPALARDYRFEAALRDRVERLVSFHHPAFPLVRPIKELGHEDGLAVVSTYASGVRLSEALKKPASPAFVLRLIRQLVPALAALQQHGAGIAHGALCADRIVVTAKGQLTIREHMVGAALGSVEFSSTRLWADFGILASPTRTTAPTLDGRSDVIQLALVALSLMAGRRIGPDEYPDKVEELLDDIAARNARLAPGTFQHLRSWLERALQLGDDLFDSARDANEALAEWQDETEGPAGPFVSLSSNMAEAPPVTDGLEDAGHWQQGWCGPHLIGPRRFEVAEAAPLHPPAALADQAAVGDEWNQGAIGRVSPVRRRFTSAVRWVAVAAASLAVGEALFIGRLLYMRAATPPPKASPVVLESSPAGASVSVDNRAAGTTPLQLNVLPPMRPAPVLPDVIPQVDRSGPQISKAPEQKERAAKLGDRVADTVQAQIGSEQSGGFRLSSAVKVHVLDGDRVLGSSGDSPIVAPAGQHEFEFVNSAIGYRERRIVDVKAGLITPISVDVPNGTLNINAVPWATVWIDGNSFGETPLGNLSVVPGEHEIVFRHPQLGERREKTIVRTDGTTRVSVNLQR